MTEEKGKSLTDQTDYPYYDDGRRKQALQRTGAQLVHLAFTHKYHREPQEKSNSDEDSWQSHNELMRFSSKKGERNRVVEPVFQKKRVTHDAGVVTNQAAVWESYMVVPLPE